MTRRARIATAADWLAIFVLGAGVTRPIGRAQRYELYTLGRDDQPGGEGEDADVGLPTIPLQR